MEGKRYETLRDAIIDALDRGYDISHDRIAGTWIGRRGVTYCLMFNTWDRFHHWHETKRI